MADTTKLASTFKAWRVTVQVSVGNLAGAFGRCKELGLQPKLRDMANYVMFSVVVPHGEDKEHTEDAFKKEMASFKGHIVNMAEAELICPPAPEVVPETRPDSLARPTYAVGG